MHTITIVKVGHQGFYRVDTLYTVSNGRGKPVRNFATMDEAIAFVWHLDVSHKAERSWLPGTTLRVAA